MNQISAFADEVGEDLDLQIATLKENGVGNIELRGVWGKNIMLMEEAEVREIKKRATDAGLGFSAVGSPLGKMDIAAGLEGMGLVQQIEGLKRVIDYAHILEAPFIRIFSFYPPVGQNPQLFRELVIDWLGKMISIAERTNIILAHENEKGIYGDTGARCLDLLTALGSDHFTAVFDFANFVQCNQRPYQDCWEKLQPYISYFHVKDALLATGQVVPAGQGDGDVEKILSEAYQYGFDSFLTLEPHLSFEGQFAGRTNPDLFKVAADALKDILNRINRSSS
jgi:3-dehydroshikimate dehydratase